MTDRRDCSLELRANYELENKYKSNMKKTTVYMVRRMHDYCQYVHHLSDDDVCKTQSDHVRQRHEYERDVEMNQH